MPGARITDQLCRSEMRQAGFSFGSHYVLVSTVCNGAQDTNKITALFKTEFFNRIGQKRLFGLTSEGIVVPVDEARRRLVLHAGPVLAQRPTEHSLAPIRSNGLSRTLFNRMQQHAPFVAKAERGARSHPRGDRDLQESARTLFLRVRLHYRRGGIG